MANRKLSTYQAKRDFSVTAEPSGDAKVTPANRLRYVIQKHDLNPPPASSRRA